MARFYPSFRDLGGLAPTKAEWELLCFLKANLDFRYEVFFHPVVGADTPDIIVMRKFRGIMIISVHDDDGADEGRKSPVARVREYCSNFDSMHLPSLRRRKRKIRAPRFAIAGCVYFHNVGRAALDETLGAQAAAEGVEILCGDELSESVLDAMLQRHNLAGPQENIDTEAEVNACARAAIWPGEHEAGTGTMPRRGNAYRFAAAAMDVYRRKLAEGIAEPRIMILCPTITLRCLINDYLKDAPEQFSGNTFIVTEYLHFIHSQLNNLSIAAERHEGMTPDEFKSMYYENGALFAGRDTMRFDAIVTDKASEYPAQWLTVLAENFLVAPNGTMTDVYSSVSVSDETDRAAEDAAAYGTPCRQKTIELAEGTLIPELFRMIQDAGTEAGNIAVLCADATFLHEFDAFYRHSSYRRTTVCLESYELMFFTTLRREPWRQLFVNSIFRVPFTREYTDDYAPCVYMARALTCIELMNRFPLQFKGRMTELVNLLKLPRQRIREVLDAHPQEYAAMRSETFGATNIAEYKKIRNGKRYNFTSASAHIKICRPEEFRGMAVRNVFFVATPGSESAAAEYADTALAEFTVIKPV